MSLQIIYGRTGTGKTMTCLNEIKKNIALGKKAFLIVPEQFSFYAEKKILETLGKAALIDAEVLSFKRMAHKIESEVGGIQKTKLTKAGKAMLITNIILKLDLKLLNPQKQGTVELLSNTISEFKRHNVTVDDIKKLCDNTENEYLRIKLADILRVYENFNKVMENNYEDADDDLIRLCENIEKTSIFNNACIYIDEFFGFTTNEYMVIEKLLKVALNVTITSCSDGIEINSRLQEADIFYQNKKTINKLIELSKANNIKVEKPIYLTETKKFKSKEISLLEQGKEHKEECKDISITLYQNEYDEIRNIAKNIKEYVTKEGYRYKDITVITKNLEKYASTIKMVFSEYDIPYYLDEKVDITFNILVKYILATLDVYIKNWSYEAMFNYIKTGLLNIEQEEINRLQNYVVMHGIKGNKWYKEDWEELNDVRKKIVEPLLTFKENLSRQKRVKELTVCLYNFLIDMQIDKTIISKAEKLKEDGELKTYQEYLTCFNTVVDLFDELVLILGEEKISFAKYYEIIKTGFKNSKIGLIPTMQDQVAVGDDKRSKNNDIKIAYIIGLNDGIFPRDFSNEGFLNDEERLEFENLGLNIAKNSKELLFDEQFNIYRLLGIPSDKLHLSYPIADIMGTALRPSMIIQKINTQFKKINKLKADDDFPQDQFFNLVEVLRGYIGDNDVKDNDINLFSWYRNNAIWKEKLNFCIGGLEFNNSVQKIDEELIQKTYNLPMKTSVSRLEAYRKCPFSYHLKYGLKLKVIEPKRIQSVDIGSFMHYAIQLIFEYIEENSVNIQDIDEDWCLKIVEKIVDNISNKTIYRNDKRYTVLLIRLKRTLKKAVWIIMQGLKNSQFKPKRA